MSTQYETGPSKVTIGVGTCIKIGFFASLGALLFSLILSIILGIILLVTGAALLPEIQRLLQNG